MFRVDILTLFTEYFTGPFTVSMVKRAVEKKALRIRLWNIRDFARDRHRTVDDVPYGGGAGMVLKPEPLDQALRRVTRGKKPPVVYLSPQGKPLTHAKVTEFSRLGRLVLICGHYEGVDERVLEKWVDEEISIGDFVLSGGEPAAAALVDAVARLLPGVVSDPRSIEQDSFATGLLDHPHYTRPKVWENREVPEVLCSGDHARIADWRRKQALIATARKRPDLLDTAPLKEEDRAFLRKLRQKRSEAI